MVHRIHAQDTTATRCAGQKIEHISIHSAAPTAALLRRIHTIGSIVGAIHTTTNPELIRRFLLLQEGDDCNELRRSESERILRAQPFIASATVDVLPDSFGTVMLDVHTTDEISLVLDGAIGHGHPPLRLIRVGDANIGGEGVYMAGNWRSGGAFRDGYGGRIVDNQLLDHPYTATAEANLNPLGSDWHGEVMHAYYTDIQRIAWRARAGGSDDYVQFLNDINSSHALRVTRSYFDIGGIFRLGPPGKLMLLGGSISGDNERPATNQVLIAKDGFEPDPSRDLLGRYVPHRIARANLLFGVRDIGFAQVRGFDALSATQDLPIGLQLGTMVGRSLSILGSRDNDYFVASDLYVGAANHHGGFRMQAETEARHDNSLGQWDGMLADGRAIEYVKFTHTNTTLASIEFSGGWKQRLPFNLTLSDPVGGVRGYAASNIPGGQRLVIRLEDHQFIGKPFEFGDFGLGAFVDGGRLWAGDIPYGVNTPVYTSVGFSILAAVPAASARLWRIDFAYALRSTGGGRFEVRFGGNDKTTFFLTEPGDIQSIRERTVPSSVFRWPQ
ncbi:MAG: hypothetical protein ABI442_21465 [Gemmatimonadaceae bacterium]